MQYGGYDFDQLQLPEMRAALEARIKEYEARIFDAMLNIKAESVTNNPLKQVAVRHMEQQISDLSQCVEMCKFELHMLDTAETTDGAEVAAE